VVGFIANVNKYLWPPTDKPFYPFLSKLCDTGRPLGELVGMVISLSVGSCLDMAQGLHASLELHTFPSSEHYSLATVQVLDFYLSDERAVERAQILELVKKDDTMSTELLRGYVREGMRKLYLILGHKTSLTTCRPEPSIHQHNSSSRR
jgi:linoleate 10R-lipoxygenase